MSSLLNVRKKRKLSDSELGAPQVRGMATMFNLSGPQTKRRLKIHLLMFMAAVIVLSIVSAVIINVALSPGSRNPYRFATKKFPIVPYSPLTPKDLSETPRPLPGRLFHVAKEFGEASMGGLGSVLTALTAAQVHSGMDVSVVIPSYSYLYEKHRFDLEDAGVATIEVELHPSIHPFHVLDPWQPLQALGELVWGPPPTRRKIQVRFHVNKYDFNGVALYLIGPGDVHPFSEAFAAEDRNDIYSFSSAFPGYYRDPYFCSAVAAFLDLEHQRSPISYVHLHGATNAMILPVMRQLPRHQRSETSAGPAFIYTLHDYNDETQYRLEIPVVQRFSPLPFPSDPVTYPAMAGKLYLSPLGIRGADVLTCVSRVMAGDILSGALEFDNKAMVFEDIADQARDRRFFGIGNGVDLDLFDPFTHPKLVAEGLQFRKKGNPMDQKLQAKSYLVDKGLIPKEKAQMKIALYVGRFQNNKGMEKCALAIPEFQRRDVLFILMGQPNNYDMRELNDNKDIVVIDDLQRQEDFGVFLRLAADFVFIPSKTEAFGLVAVEGMLFGSLVITTGVGGLRDFLIDRKQGTPALPHNAYFFEYKSLPSLQSAIGEAIAHTENMGLAQRGELCRRLMSTAQGMSWKKIGGPTDQYSAVYHLAKLRQSEPRKPFPARDLIAVPML